LRGDTHQVEQHPGADFRRQGRVGCSIQAEEHGLSVANDVLQGESGPKVLPGNPFDDESEACSESGDTLAFELAESVDETAQSGGLRCAEVAQQGHEPIRFEKLEYAVGRPLQAGQVDRLDQPQQVTLRGCSIDVCIA
jgi:hypothetical protein